MLTHYFSDPVMLDLIQRTPAAAYLDCLSAELVATGYKPTIQRYLPYGSAMPAPRRPR
jgi:hypothetical protein